MTIELDLHDSISKNLPSHVGDVLKKRLEQADVDRRTVESLVSASTDLLDQVAAANAKLLKANQELNSHAELAKREAAVAEAERNAKVAELTIKLEAETRVSGAFKDFTMGLVRNTEWRETIRNQTPVVFPGANGSPGWTQVHEARNEVAKTAA